MAFFGTYCIHVAADKNSTCSINLCESHRDKRDICPILHLTSECFKWLQQQESISVGEYSGLFSLIC